MSGIPTDSGDAPHRPPAMIERLVLAAA